MEKENLIKGMMGILVCIILLGGLLLPVVSNAMVISGTPVEFKQQGSINASFEIGKVDREIIIDFVDGGLKVGDVTYTNLSTITTWTPFVYSDNVQCMIRSSNSAVQFNVFENLAVTTTNLVVGDRLTVTPASVTLSGSTDITVETGNVYAIGSNASDKITVIDMGDRNNNTLPLINSINDIVCVGFYSTGELDTYYRVIDGVVKVNDNYTASLNYNFQLKDGTTDIYEIETFKIRVSDGATTEEYVPYYALIPSKVQGHADSGAVYSLLGVLPIMTIISVILAGIYVFISRKY